MSQSRSSARSARFLGVRVSSSVASRPFGAAGDDWGTAAAAGAGALATDEADALRDCDVIGVPAGVSMRDENATNLSKTSANSKNSTGLIHAASLLRMHTSSPENASVAQSFCSTMCAISASSVFHCATVYDSDGSLSSVSIPTLICGASRARMLLGSLTRCVIELNSWPSTSSLCKKRRASSRSPTVARSISGKAASLMAMSKTIVRNRWNRSSSSLMRSGFLASTRTVISKKNRAASSSTCTSCSRADSISEQRIAASNSAPRASCGRNRLSVMISSMRHSATSSRVLRYAGDVVSSSGRLSLSPKKVANGHMYDMPPVSRRGV
eukprot:Unigene8112_Nuclearia_a/m.24882 Unigene8112_Nuclearia_a/g.24882  ORF Unigene8112_Nuclearia_a/g.24882 Unigene8112_Nuclearia_a/m.24882 type:complete len:326 (+) Unigene8112_Nuclearia_a:787-1764(+)